MAGKRVAFFDPYGNFGTVDESEAEQLPDGSRVLTKQQVAQRNLEEEYAAKSTGEKVVGALTGQGIGPASQAFLEAGRSGFSAGTNQAASRIARDAIAPGAGKAYADHLDELATGEPGATTAGTVAGIAGSVATGVAGGAVAGGGVARALPVNALSAAGGALEAGVSRALGGLATRGALGRAASTAASMAVRGAAEGAAYAGIESAADSVTHDTPIAGEKLYAALGHGALMGGALGGALGFGGSLLASGAKRAASGLARGGMKVDEAGEALEAGLVAKGASAVKRGVLDVLADPTAAARAASHEQAWSAVGRGNGLQSTRHAKAAAKYFGGPEGTKALGEIAIRHGAFDMGAASASPAAAAWQAAKLGTVADILPKLEAAQSSVGRQIGEITESSGARIRLHDIGEAFGAVRDKYDRIAGNEHVTAAIDSYVTSLDSKLPRSLDGHTVSLQDLLEQRKGLDQIVFQETKTLDPGRRVAAMRELRSEMEDVITKSLDDASGMVPGELQAQYKALKKDYHGLSILTDLAEDSAARSSKGATFSLTSKIIGGAASTTGGLIGGLIGGGAGALIAGPIAGGAAALATKVAQERGSAAAAAFLSRAADKGTFTKLIRQFDERISRAAVGALKEASPRAPAAAIRETSRAVAKAKAATAETSRADTAATQSKAQAIVKWIGDARANPTKLMDQLEEASAIIGKSAGPLAAESYTAATLRAINFIAGHIPVKERRDPLDPRSVPPFSYEEADRLVRAAKYAVKPETVWDDFERGKVTPEGLRAAKTFQAESFVQFQGKLRDEVERHMLDRRRLNDTQRLRIGMLLGSPAGASLRAPALARLQANLMRADKGPAQAPQTGGPVNMKVEPSGFDAVEARMTS